MALITVDEYHASCFNIPQCTRRGTLAAIVWTGVWNTLLPDTDLFLGRPVTMMFHLEGYSQHFPPLGVAVLTCVSVTKQSL